MNRVRVYDIYCYEFQNNTKAALNLLTLKSDCILTYLNKRKYTGNAA